MLRDRHPLKFHIVGEYSTRRIYQRWEESTGQVVWDGESAWSNDWGFEDRCSPRFTTSIGFYLANMPWYLLDPDTEFISRSEGIAAIPGSDKLYTVLEVQFEADSVRKPRGLIGARDHFGIIIDTQSHQVAGIIERRTYAGQLDLAGAPADQSSFADVFVIEGTVQAGGLTWPGRYSLHTLSGKKYGEGQFCDYAVKVPFEDGWMRPESANERAGST